MKINGLFIALLLAMSTPSLAQDEIELICYNFDAQSYSAFILATCALTVIQEEAIPGITEVGFDQRASGYYRHCWNNPSEFAMSPWYPRASSYPSSGPVNVFEWGDIAITKFIDPNSSPPMMAHWDPLLENRAQAWYVEASTKHNYESPVTKNMTWTPSPCT
ncbi:MAG: hypothetical protein Q8L06_05525 [Pseudohongiella sp.]|nr:hypothetical protein [Pseudohongiella sp.]